MAAKPTTKKTAARTVTAKTAARAATAVRAANKTPTTKPGRKGKVTFPKKNQPPTDAEFVARLPMPAGKRFEMVRGFLKKQKDVAEELYFFGPRTGWAYRYLRGGQQSVCSIMIHDDRLLGIVALDAGALATIDWGSLSPIGQKAKRLAHGSPTMLWVDVPLDGTGAADFRALCKAKLKALPSQPPPPPPPRTTAR